jgi:hypothetical protein
MTLCCGPKYQDFTENSWNQEVPDSLYYSSQDSNENIKDFKNNFEANDHWVSCQAAKIHISDFMVICIQVQQVKCET